ncbi:MAG TPA: ribonuclease H-like domain-containing protein [Kiritimatiellia bacterium]|nr:ribonuclease H-like domain-containing protein [Kiritimatiellia bacterium]
MRHVTGAFMHLPGFGPKRISAARSRGVNTWMELLREHHADLPGLDDSTPGWVKTVRQCEVAVQSGDLRFLVNTFHRAEQWRILADFMQDASFLDIETSGDQLRPEITLIMARHRGRMYTFMADRNLDDFLALMDEIRLLVTFNGASFDVPQMENHFHIPMRDIPHIDLRWLFYHVELRGGLKEIERNVGLQRPPDLAGMDGAEADWLWRRWKATGNRKLLDRLVRYCAADVIGLEHLSRWLIARQTGATPPIFDWTGLPECDAALAPRTPLPIPDTSSAEKRLRERLRAMRANG